MAEAGAVVVLSNARSVAELHKMLQKTDKSAVMPNVSNLILIIGFDPILAGMCGYDEFQSKEVIHHAAPSPIESAPSLPGPYPRSWNAADVSQVQSYIQRTWCQAKKPDVHDAMVAVAHGRRFHPIRDWLDGLKWDNIPRLDTWLRSAFGAEDSDYVRDVGRCFMIASVRRVRQPGVKHDHMMILEGEQGLGKSTAIKTLFGEQWFTDSMPADIDSKDAAIALQGVWCVEFAEIAQIIRQDVEVIKGFLTRAVDRYRPPYAKTPIPFPRQCVTFGTTNARDYLRDDTGNRRFWPLWCNFVELEWLTENRDQLWAEASARERAGEDHWLREADSLSQATEAQSERLQEDVWSDKIASFVETQSRVRTSDVLEALSIPLKDQDRRAQLRVASVLKSLGFEQCVDKTPGQKSIRRWRRKE